MINEREEAEANYFAMCLLIPEDMIRKDLEGESGFDIVDDPRIKNLARRDGVSIQTMIIRLADLGFVTI